MPLTKRAFLRKLDNLPMLQLVILILHFLHEHADVEDGVFKAAILYLTGVSVFDGFGGVDDREDLVGEAGVDEGGHAFGEDFERFYLVGLSIEELPRLEELWP